VTSLRPKEEEGTSRGFLAMDAPGPSAVDASRLIGPRD